MSLIGFAQLLSRVSNGFKRRPAGITVKVRFAPITEVPNWARRWALIGAAVPLRLMMPRSTKFAQAAGRLAYAVRNTGARGCDGRISANATWMMPPASPSATPMRQAIVYEPSAS